jgi:flagellin
VFSGATTQSFDLYLNGYEGKATVIVTATDTLEGLAGKISTALWQPGGGGLLGQSGIIDPDEPPQLVRVNEVGTARGTLSIAVPLPGAELVIAGNDDMVDAMDFTVNIAGRAPTYSVAAVDATTGESIGSVETGTNQANGLIPGVTIYFDNSMNMTLDPEPPVGGTGTNGQWPYNAPDETPALSITAYDTADEFYIHVAPNPLVMQIGARTGQTLSMVIPDTGAEALGVLGLNVSTQELASAAIGTVDTALQRASMAQSRAGAYQNRLESTINELDVAAENTLAAESRIRDLDYASEIIALTRARVLTQSSMYALAQANLQARAVLSLLAA